jgi:hypothetical protein
MAKKHVIQNHRHNIRDIHGRFVGSLFSGVKKTQKHIVKSNKYNKRDSSGRFVAIDRNDIGTHASSSDRYTGNPLPDGMCLNDNVIYCQEITDAILTKICVFMDGGLHSIEIKPDEYGKRYFVSVVKI